jgi:hypothetical protein
VCPPRHANVCARASQGTGRLHLPCGSVYEGRFFGDKQHGFGRLAVGDLTYEGEFRGGVIHGKGRQERAGGAVYTGEWADGERHGLGEYRAADGTVYSGAYVRNQRAGKGTLLWADGTRYDGAFERGLRHGRGHCVWPGGDVYEGEYADGRKEGVGRFTAANGDTYEGAFARDVPHGFGEYTFANSDKYVGGYRSGQRHGDGVHTSGGFKHRTVYSDGYLVATTPMASTHVVPCPAPLHDSSAAGRVPDAPSRPHRDAPASDAPFAPALGLRPSTWRGGGRTQRPAASKCMSSQQRSWASSWRMGPRRARGCSRTSLAPSRPSCPGSLRDSRSGRGRTSRSRCSGTSALVKSSRRPSSGCASKTRLCGRAPRQRRTRQATGGHACEARAHRPRSIRTWRRLPCPAGHTRLQAPRTRAGMGEVPRRVLLRASLPPLGWHSQCPSHPRCRWPGDDLTRKAAS